MRSTCIDHPSSEPLIIIRQWQIEFCEGNQCAAALLSYLEYWHNIKIDQQGKANQFNEIQERHADPPTQENTLWQWHSYEEIEKGILIYKRDTIRNAVKFLIDKGILAISNNPNPRYKFDKTTWFLLNVEVINNWLNFDYRKINNRMPKNQQSMPKNQQPSLENRQAISEVSFLDSSKKEEKIISLTRNNSNLAIADFSPISKPLFDLEEIRSTEIASPSNSATVENQQKQNEKSPTDQTQAKKASKKKASEKPAPDPRASHPAIVAVRSIIAGAESKEFPNKFTWDSIIEKLGENPNLDKLKDCATAWSLKGYRIGNLAWLDWYSEGIPLSNHQTPPKIERGSVLEANNKTIPLYEKENRLPTEQEFLALPQYRQRLLQNYFRQYCVETPLANIVVK